MTPPSPPFPHGTKSQGIVQWSGLVAAWTQVAPPALVTLCLILLLSRPIGLWTFPVAGVAVGGLSWLARRYESAGLRELARFVGGFLVFTALRHLADDLGPPAYIRYPIVADRILGGGALPSLWLQQRLVMLTYPAVVVYTSYFFVPPLAVGIVWKYWPDRLRRYVTATLALFFVAAIVHIVIPTAPPWIAARMGYISGVRPLVLDYYHAAMPAAYQLGTGVSANFVAAMPSVHLGVTTLILCALWSTPLRWFATAYLAVMAFTVVFTGDHYVVDVIAGVGLAIGAWRWAKVRPPQRPNSVQVRMDESVTV